MTALRFGGKRRAIRRAEEVANSYVDRPSPQVVFLVLFLVGASIIDAHLTLLRIGAGSYEVNPVMGLALGLGPGFFAALKMGLTAVGAIVLSLHQLFPLGLKSLRFVVAGYGLVLLYHALVFFQP